jgi:hypothetical protein
MHGVEVTSEGRGELGRSRRWAHSCPMERNAVENGPELAQFSTDDAIRGTRAVR